MTVIVVASPKGGSGKSTTSLILATGLASLGLRTCVIDADKNKPIWGWQEDGGKADNLTIIRYGGEDKILDDIEEAERNSDFVIVDPEGSANLTIAYAISRADFVIVPLQRSKLDAGLAAKAVALIKQQCRVIGRDIPFSLLITQTNPAIRTRALKRMVESMETNKIDCFHTEVNQRETFKALFDYGVTLEGLPSDFGGLENAKANAAEFVAEVFIKLKKIAVNKQEAA